MQFADGFRGAMVVHLMENIVLQLKIPGISGGALPEQRFHKPSSVGAPWRTVASIQHKELSFHFGCKGDPLARWIDADGVDLLL